MRTFILFLLVPFISFSQTLPQKANELMNEYSRQGKFSGNVLIAQKGRILLERSYGWANREMKKPNNLTTEFRAGSLTKMFTATAIMKLQEKGMVSLSDPVSRYISNVENGDSIRIVDLLSHSSGLKGNPEVKTKNLQDYVLGCKYEHSAFRPGSRFEYNNLNYILLSYIIEKVTHKSYSAFLKEDVMEHAGMKHSGLDFYGRTSNNQALGYELDQTGENWQYRKDEDVDMAFGAGALYTTIGDLYQWSRAIATNKLLSDSSYKKVFTPLQGNYGLGFMVEARNGRRFVGHAGSIQGYVAYFAYYPEEDITMIYLSNYKDINADQLVNDLNAVIFDLPYHLPQERKIVHLSNGELQKYAGVYQMDNGFTITVSVDHEKLFALPQGDPDKTEFTPLGNNKFFLKGIETEIEFVEDQGKVNSLLIQMHGTQKLKRVES